MAFKRAKKKIYLEEKKPRSHFLLSICAIYDTYNNFLKRNINFSFIHTTHHFTLHKTSNENFFHSLLFLKSKKQTQNCVWKNSQSSHCMRM